MKGDSQTEHLARDFFNYYHNGNNFWEYESFSWYIQHIFIVNENDLDASNDFQSRNLLLIKKFEQIRKHHPIRWWFMKHIMKIYI